MMDRPPEARPVPQLEQSSAPKPQHQANAAGYSPIQHALSPLT